jgi:hypothetical protein
MAAKGIHKSPLFKLGKAPVKRDRRNLLFANILRAPPKLPKEYDFDLVHPGTPTPMFANDRLGDCVIAGRAHQTLRFELMEQKKLIGIKDTDVTTEYFKETGGGDTGLVVLESLKLWRKSGWRAAAKRYYIHAFAQLNLAANSEIKRAVYLDLGAGLGVQLPLTAQDQILAGKPWTVVSGAGSAVGSWGGHYVYVPGYTTVGPVCVTWGRKQQMSWGFFHKYCDEAYAIIDAIDTPKKKKALDEKKLTAFLAKL